MSKLNDRFQGIEEGYPWLVEDVPGEVTRNLIRWPEFEDRDSEAVRRRKYNEKQSIRAAVKKSFNAEEIKNLISSTQITGIRDNMAKMTQDFNLSRIDKNTYLRDMLTALGSL